jgi:hypothetical protein
MSSGNYYQFVDGVRRLFGREIKSIRGSRRHRITRRPTGSGLLSRSCVPPGPMAQVRIGILDGLDINKK